MASKAERKCQKMYDRARFMYRKMHNLYGMDCFTSTYEIEEPDRPEASRLERRTVGQNLVAP